MNLAFENNPEAIAAGIDIETTGLSAADGHRIIEIGVRLYNYHTGQFKGKFVQRINPMRPIDQKAQEVHGISFEELAGEPTWEEIAPKLSAVMSKVQVIIAHNGIYFDLPFINFELMRVGLPIIELPVIDTMMTARWATCSGKNPNLGELCFACDVPYDPDQAHGADYDIDVMCQCFFKYKSHFIGAINNVVS